MAAHGMWQRNSTGLVWRYKETVSSAHHAYQCTASMDRDTILHQAGYIIREAVEEGLGDELAV